MPEITELPVGTAPDGTEVLPAVQGGVTKKITGLASIAYVDAAITASVPVSGPQGRLTLQSGSQVISSDQTSKQNLYYAPACGTRAPLLVSAAWESRAFTSSATDQVGLTLALAGSANWASGTVHDVFLIDDGADGLRLATRLWDAGMFPTEAQITNATAITTGTGADDWARVSAAFDGNLSQNAATGAMMTTISAIGVHSTKNRAFLCRWQTGCPSRVVVAFAEHCGVGVAVLVTSSA